MKKILFSKIALKIVGFLCIVMSFFVGMSLIGAEWTLTNGADFMIDLSEIDPIHNASKGGEGWIASFREIVQKIGNIMLFMIIPILAGVAVVIAGYFLIFSYASDENVTRAKTILKFNLVAILVAFLSGAIISAIATFVL